MPLHTHTSGEQVHTVPGSAEDARLHAHPAWRLDDPTVDALPPDHPDVDAEGDDQPSEETP